ncbi:hypothetical protein J437_LFUL005886 [Ladona fulva]|uniref:Uncharacterized protein n=1 Tax=Ladona fulva TaxID=123851 RepID=A0A8K0NZ57_LADFU|nr:hypothetical protein J437_LFUL005886 [Ladona fulva]
MEGSLSDHGKERGGFFQIQHLFNARDRQWEYSADKQKLWSLLELRMNYRRKERYSAYGLPQRKVDEHF